jgi:hypothetical protein
MRSSAKAFQSAVSMLTTAPINCYTCVFFLVLHDRLSVSALTGLALLRLAVCMKASASLVGSNVSSSNCLLTVFAKQRVHKQSSTLPVSCVQRMYSNLNGYI